MGTSGDSKPTEKETTTETKQVVVEKPVETPKPEDSDSKK